MMAMAFLESVVVMALLAEFVVGILVGMLIHKSLGVRVHITRGFQQRLGIGRMSE